MKQELMSIWGRLIVTVSTLQASAWNVPLMVWIRHDKRMQSSCPPYLPTASPPLTHTHLNTSSSTLCTPSPASKRQPGVLSLTLFHLFSHIALRERTTPVDYMGEGRKNRPRCRQLQLKGNITDDWYTARSYSSLLLLIIAQSQFTFLSTLTLLTVHRFKQRRWLPHHHLSFIRLLETQKSLF